MEVLSMLRSARVLLALAAAAAVTGVAAPATAATAASPAPWQPFRSTPFDEAAGDVCPFALHADIVADHEQFRTLEAYPDGSPREQQFEGLLVIRYTNVSTGANVVRNLTGGGYFFFDPDGTITGYGDGHLGLSVHAGNTDPPPGEYVLTGAFSFALDADGSRTFDVQGGTVENLCETLA
jgi:hypothetical protein